MQPLQNIIVIALCAVIVSAQDWQEIETFGRKRRDWLKRFLTLTDGIPSHDTFERVFDRLHPQAFQACFRDWVEALQQTLPIPHVAIDGKTLCGSGAQKLGALHLVSSWAATQRLSLGQVAVDGKSNEITAIPALLELLDLEGALVTIDAMDCQKGHCAEDCGPRRRLPPDRQRQSGTLADRHPAVVRSGVRPRFRRPRARHLRTTRARPRPGIVSSLYGVA